MTTAITRTVPEHVGNHADQNALGVSGTDHNSGQLRNGDGPYVFIAEIPPDREPRMQVVLKVPDADAFVADPSLDVVKPFEDTHFGTREMTVRDPDGRLWSLQASAKR